MIDFVSPRQLLVGAGSLRQLPSLLQENSKNNIFIVAYDAAASCVQAVIHGLSDAGMAYVVYDSVKSEPDLQVIDQGAQLCISKKCDAVVAIGGGSVIDSAKTIAMLATNGGQTIDYQLGGREVTISPLFFVAVPTTAGTGAEATKVSVVYNPEKGWKKAIYHTSMISRVTILDAETTTGLPASTTVATGMDAITHAIESYVSVFANPVSQMYSLEALSLLANNIEAVAEHPNDLAAREAMLLGSYFAGCAISVGTCLAHIAGQPLGAIYSIPHGNACAIFLVPSMELNLESALPQYVDIAKTLGVSGEGKEPEAVAREGIERLRGLARRLNLPARLTDYVSIDKVDVDKALDNIQESMGHIKTNPRLVDRNLLETLIRSVL